MYEVGQILKVIEDYTAWAKEHPAPGNMDQWWLETLQAYLKGELNPTARWWVERNMEIVLSYGIGTHIKNENFTWPEDVPRPWEGERQKPKPPSFNERSILLHHRETNREQHIQFISNEKVWSSYIQSTLNLTGPLFKKKT